MEPTANQHPQAKPAIVKEYQDLHAILETEDLQVLRWPISQLPPGTAIGDKVYIVLHSAKGEVEERQKLAHTILNQIFTGEADKQN